MAKMPGVTVKVKEYEILESSSLKYLAEQVTTKLAENWIPLGGVSVAIIEGSDYRMNMYMQAVIRMRMDGD